MGNGQLVLTIDTRADSISNDDQASDIITNQRQIQTTVQIKDGQTLLLGGLSIHRLAMLSVQFQL